MKLDTALQIERKVCTDIPTCEDADYVVTGLSRYGDEVSERIHHRAGVYFYGTSGEFEFTTLQEAVDSIEGY
jgi:hypothetical protein